MTLQDPTFGKLLRHFRDCLDWTQEHAAYKLGVAPRTYQDWEEGKRIPNSTNCDKIVSIFQLNEEQANALRRAASQVAPEIHNLPFQQNRYFTGRKTYLEQLDQYFKENASVAISQPISISGLGGIGKTQLALEYAHRSYRKAYRSILWVNAADQATLEASYLSLANLLGLPEKDEPEINRIVQAMKIWLERHTGWLLILDNADDLQLARSYLPTKPRGHILLTTRTQILGNIATRIEVEAMQQEEALLFLLRRSGELKDGIEPDTIASDIRSPAAQLVEILGGHPLALDQAGAYIEETRISIATYLQLYQEQRRILLNERGQLGDEHPETVAVTFEVSFKQACEMYPLVGEILYFCSFLHPDAIPEELLFHDESLNLNALSFNKAIAALLRYSLIKRKYQEQVLSIHRLVQVVIRDGMDKESEKRWVERTVLLVSNTFPKVEYQTWPQCERLLPHALICADLLREHHFIIPQSIQLFSKAGYYLYLQAHFDEAEQVLTQALQIQEEPELDHPDREQILYDKVQILNDLGLLYFAKHKNEQAETLLQKALTIQEKLNDPNPAQSLWILGLVYYGQGKDEEAEQYYQRALAIREEVYKKDEDPDYEDPRVATVLNNLALLYDRQGKVDEAERLYKRALMIEEKALGPVHPDLARTLRCFAELYFDQGKYDQAEPLARRALEMNERIYGSQHPVVGMSLTDLAMIYHEQEKYEEAEALYQKAIEVFEGYSEPKHLDAASIRRRLARLYHGQNKYLEAEQLYQQVLAIFEQQLGPNDGMTALILCNLAQLYDDWGKYEQAERFYQQSLVIYQQQSESEHSLAAQILNRLAILYHKHQKYEEAEPLLQQALTISERQFGPENLNTATILHNLALLYDDWGKYKQAKWLYYRAWEIRGQLLGSEHQTTVETWHRYSSLLQVGQQVENDFLEIDQIDRGMTEEGQEMDVEE
jgi:tetratricopeptide (TPR) repeat protein